MSNLANFQKPPNEDTIRLLRDALAAAEAGTLQRVVLVGLTTNVASSGRYSRSDMTVSDALAMMGLLQIEITDLANWVNSVSADCE